MINVTECCASALEIYCTLCATLRGHELSLSVFSTDTKLESCWESGNLKTFVCVKPIFTLYFLTVEDLLVLHQLILIIYSTTTNI